MVAGIGILDVVRAAILSPLPVGNNPLCAPGVDTAAYQLLTSAVGTRRTDGAAPLPLVFTAWDSGTSTKPGVASKPTTTLAGFNTVLVACACEDVCADKVQSPCFMLATTTGGGRKDGDVTAITGLVLDADHVGDWDLVRLVLTDLGLAHLVYRSPSYAPATAIKWRLLLPFETPFPITNTYDAHRWTAFYHALRTIFGAVAHLDRAGFDGVVSNVNRIWFGPTRPSATHPIREVAFVDGYALDWRKLVQAWPAAIPDVADPYAKPGRPHAGPYKRSVLPSILHLIFERLGLLGDAIDDNITCVKCPRDIEHTEPIGDGSPDDSTILFAPSSWQGEFFCHHNHTQRRPDLFPDPAPPDKAMNAAYVIALLERQYPALKLRAWAEHERDPMNQYGPIARAEARRQQQAVAPFTAPVSAGERTPPAADPLSEEVAAKDAAKYAARQDKKTAQRASRAAANLAKQADAAAKAAEAAVKRAEAALVAAPTRADLATALAAAKKEHQAAKAAAEARHAEALPLIAAFRAAAAAAEDAEIARAALGILLDKADDLTMAKHLLDEPGPRAHWVFDEGVFYRYAPARGVWQLVDREDLRAEIYKRFEYASVKAPTDASPNRTVPVQLNDPKVKHVVETLADLTRKKGFFASAIPGVAFRNGVVKVVQNGVGKKLLLHAHSPENAQRHCVDWDFAPAQLLMNRPLAWEQYCQAARLDRATQQVILEFAGACFFGKAPRYKRALVVCGAPDCGKSVLLDLIAGLFPDTARAELPPGLWGKRFQIQDMVGRLINAADELPAQKITNNDTFKKVVSGGAVGGAEKKGKDTFSFRPIAGHCFAANDLPPADDLSGGFFIRWIVIPLTRVVPEDEQNKNLTEEILKADRERLVLQAVHAYLQLVERGSYAPSEISLKAKREWEEESDHAARYLREKWTAVAATYPQDWIATETLYGKYREWCEGQGIPVGEIVKQDTFGKTLTREHFEKKVKTFTQTQGDKKVEKQQRGWLAKPNHWGVTIDAAPLSLQEQLTNQLKGKGASA